MDDEQLRKLKSECEQLEALKQEYEQERADLQRRLEQMKADENRDDVDNEEQLKRQQAQDEEKLQSDKRDHVKKKLREITGVDKADVKEYMAFNSIAVKYYPEVEDGDTEAFNREDHKEAFFRINRGTTFKNLRDTACKFWGITSENMALRAPNHALMDLYYHESIYETILNQHLQPEFYLYLKNPFSNTIMTRPQECFLNEEFSKNMNRQKKSSKKKGYSRSERRKDLEQLEKMYLGLKSYKAHRENLSEDPVETERLWGKYGSFLSFLMVLLLFFCTISILIVRRNVSDDYWIQSGIHASLLHEFGSGITFFEITNFSGLSNFILEVVGPSFIAAETLTRDTLLDRFFLVGPLTFRVVRTKERDCDTAAGIELDAISCYHLEYNEDTRSEATLEVESTSSDPYCTGFTEFHTADENEIDHVFKGEFSSYDGSGYVWNVPVSDYSLNAFEECYNSTISSVWLDRPTRALFINANLYAPNYDTFITFLISFEITASGYVYPSKLAATVIRTHVYLFDSNLDIFATVCEGLRMLGAFYFLYLYIRLGRENRSHFYSVRGLIDLIIFALAVAALSMSLYLTLDHSEVFDNQDRYYDLQGLGEKYITHLVLNVWLLMLILFRFISIFNISRRVHTFLLTLEYASADIVYLVVIMIPLLTGLLLTAYNQWGPALDYYRSIGWAFLSSILFTLGYGNIEELLEVNEVATITFFLIYFFVLVFFIFSAFLGILIDAYRRVRLRNDKIEEEIGPASDNSCKNKCKQLKAWVKHSFTRR